MDYDSGLMFEMDFDDVLNAQAWDTPQSDSISNNQSSPQHLDNVHQFPFAIPSTSNPLLSELDNDQYLQNWPTGLEASPASMPPPSPLSPEHRNLPPLFGGPATFSPTLEAKDASYSSPPFMTLNSGVDLSNIDPSLRNTNMSTVVPTLQYPISLPQSVASAPVNSNTSVDSAAVSGSQPTPIWATQLFEFPRSPALNVPMASSSQQVAQSQTHLYATSQQGLAFPSLSVSPSPSPSSPGGGFSTLSAAYSPPSVGIAHPHHPHPYHTHTLSHSHAQHLHHLSRNQSRRPQLQAFQPASAPSHVSMATIRPRVRSRPTSMNMFIPNSSGVPLAVEHARSYSHRASSSESDAHFNPGEAFPRVGSAPNAVGVVDPKSIPQLDPSSAGGLTLTKAEPEAVLLVESPALESDPDATIRQKRKKANKRLSSETPFDHDYEQERSRRTSFSGAASSDIAEDAVITPHRSELRPPKLAPSTWQLFFTDWIQKHQTQQSLGDASSGRKKLNVAQAAKEAGLAYANLTPEEKEPYKRKSQAAKEARERELAQWQRTLTPDDIKRENAFRAAQRKAGKSRKGNIKDPNAPKKPLSAYFMFLQHIRSDEDLVRRVFGEERETTAQSVLAAKWWREMSDEERRPFLLRAEREKGEYEAQRRLYESGTVGIETTINFGNDEPDNNFVAVEPFGTSPKASGTRGYGMGEPGTTFITMSPATKVSEFTSSESDSEGFRTDDVRGGELRFSATHSRFGK